MTAEPDGRQGAAVAGEFEQMLRDRLLDGIAAIWLWARSFDVLPDQCEGDREAAP
jgi:hypothetical protein